MKRIHIDADLCQGTRLCEAFISDVVEFDDDGVASAKDTLVSDGAALRAESACPSMAIALSEA